MTKENWIGWLQKRIPALKHKAYEFYIDQALEWYKNDFIKEVLIPKQKHKNKELATKIRLLAIHAPNKDVMSCDFGNWFAENVEKLLDDEVKKKNNNIGLNNERTLS